MSRKEVAINLSGGSFLFTLLLISVRAGLLNIPGFEQAIWLNPPLLTPVRAGLLNIPGFEQDIWLNPPLHHKLDLRMQQVFWHHN
ncbi:hypothetical protein [Chroococcidiopsis sp. CCMEE 29]|uniref:hypothetical protein n=1 Tax=Chroococcidiopsis sp. CCMEE 29 TaxID=155894 RepID=UPI00202101C2|nr:hypothetical protein [Chroococcidiopsis sp. CCMEE 29]